MPDLRVPLEDALRAAVLAAWPEVTVGGVYQGYDAFREAWDVLQARNTTLVVLDITTEPATFPADARAEMNTCKIYYVASDATDKRALAVKTSVLADYLYLNPLSVGQLRGNPSTAMDRQDPINSLFIDTQKPWFVGCVTAMVLMCGRNV